jgi:molybdopterin-binding protein
MRAPFLLKTKGGKNNLLWVTYSDQCMLELLDISVKLANFSLKSVSISVEKGDYFILLGISGAGKSMLLETIAGLVPVEKGSISLEGRDITNEKIQRRRIGLVFQDHAVFPHMSVRENIAYPLHGTENSSSVKERKITKIARELNISSLLNRRPLSLSGGELQRVALARTLIQEPKILLLDEPLASLDTQLRSELRGLLRSLNRNGQTILHVTHEYEEAISLGNKIAVMHNGEILQTGTPMEVFQHPRSAFVAHFTGARNFFRVKTLKRKDYTIAVISDKVCIHLPVGSEENLGYIIIREEDITLSHNRLESSAVNNFEGRVKDVIPSRTGIEVLVDIGVVIHAIITRESMNHLGIAEGNLLWISFKASAIKFIRA